MDFPCEEAYEAVARKMMMDAKKRKDGHPDGDESSLSAAKQENDRLRKELQLLKDNEQLRKQVKDEHAKAAMQKLDRMQARKDEEAKKKRHTSSPARLGKRDEAEAPPAAARDAAKAKAKREPGRAFHDLMQDSTNFLQRGANGAYEDEPPWHER